MRGDGSSAARFEARLPREGHWKLEIYVPKAVFEESNYGWSTSLFGMQRDNFRKRRADPNSPTNITPYKFGMEILNARKNLT